MVKGPFSIICMHQQYYCSIVLFIRYSSKLLMVYIIFIYQNKTYQLIFVNIITCVINDQTCVPFVVSTIRWFPHS